MRVISGEELKVRKRAMDLMLMLNLNDAVNHLAMVNSVYWYGHVSRRVLK